MHLFPKIKSDILFDSHAHISSPEYDLEIDNIVNSAKENGVEAIFDISVNLESSKKSIELSKRFPDTVYSFIGVDPEVFIEGSPFFIGYDVEDKWFEQQYYEISKLFLENGRSIAGIGETGMDYYHDREQNTEMRLQGRSLQEKLFKMHLELAQTLKLPLSIHSRFAEKECLEIVKNYDASGIFHSYTGDYETAKNILDAGWGLGVNGIITFKNSEDLREVYRKILRKIPEDVTPDYFYGKGIYFETDSPFLSPDGKRGEKNEPANIKNIFESFVTTCSDL